MLSVIANVDTVEFPKKGRNWANYLCKDRYFLLSTDDIYRVPLMSSSGSEYINASFINVGIITDVFRTQLSSTY